jgi:hypothetical protein
MASTRASISTPLYATLLLVVAGEQTTGLAIPWAAGRASRGGTLTSTGAGALARAPSGQLGDEDWVLEEGRFVEDIVGGGVVGSNVDFGFIIGVEVVSFRIDVIRDIVDDGGFHFLRESFNTYMYLMSDV